MSRLIYQRWSYQLDAPRPSDFAVSTNNLSMDIILAIAKGFLRFLPQVSCQVGKGLELLDFRKIDVVTMQTQNYIVKSVKSLAICKYVCLTSSHILNEKFIFLYKSLGGKRRKTSWIDPLLEGVHFIHSPNEIKELPISPESFEAK